MAGIGGQKPPSQDWLVRRVEDLEREVRRLKSARSLSASSFRGGVFLFQDEDGNTRFALGNAVLPENSFITGTDVYGMTAWDDGGSVALAALEGNRGLVYPTFQGTFHRPDPITVTSGTFVSVFEDFWDVPPAPVLRVALAVQTDVGTVGEVRLFDGITDTATDVLSLPSGTNSFADFEWLHPATTGIGDDRVGRQLSFFPSIQVRRVSGAGNVTIFPPLRQYLASTSAYPNADANGNPRLF
jgi:hypothetical protein